MKLSSVFEEGQRIPDKYTCKGEDISPPMIIEGVPEGAKSLVLIMDDPDAPNGNWDHWIVFNMMPSTELIEEGENVGKGGKNSWGRDDYGGPCPPSGTHRYIFKLYALDIELSLEEGVSKQEVEAAIEGHIIDQANLMGVYSK